MSRNWTIDQEKAINARQGSLLLSAAAGSGKTAVLVERVIRRLTDKDNPSSPERLLIVTFTKAATAEMKQKIISQVTSLAAKNPKDRSLIRLQMQMQNTNISTMDSFCARLIRENFSSLNISPDFRTCDGGELILMRLDALEKTIDYLHSNQSEDLEPLFEMFFRGSSDKLLADTIEKLYESACSYPFPELWLDEVENMYTKPESTDKSQWFKTLFKDIKNTLDYCEDINNKSIEMISSQKAKEEGLYEVLYENFEIISEHIRKCNDLAAQNKWDDLIEYSGNMHFNTMRKGKKSPLKDSLGTRHNAVKKILNEDIVSVLTASEYEHKEDMSFLEPIVKGLIFAVKLFTQFFDEIKKEANVLDFSDILHHAIDLLYEKKDDKILLSPFAKELSEQFDEVLIDEYQDTNKAQDMLFRGISNNENNLFMVGDIKQSIYAFRLANPEIFIEQSEKLPLYENENYPAKINLSKNFRSKKNILDVINFIFMQIMSRDTGSVEYDENEKLYSGRAEIENNQKDDDVENKENEAEENLNCVENEIDTELHFINYDSKDIYENATVAEAEYLAKLIKNMVKSKALIKIDGVERSVEYGDFCILLRSAKSNIPIFSDILRKNLIPTQGENSRGFFESREISFLLALLKIIDNPLNDVELLSVLLSPLYGFKEDEIALMRIKNRSANIYELLISERQDENIKVISFLNDLQKYRSLSVTGSISNFIRKLIADTKYLAIVSSMDNNDERKNNVSLLISYAENYDSWGSVGLSGFMRYIERLKQNERENKNSSTKSATMPLSNSNSVKIMSIHASKGLEFPIVILAKAMQRFNLQDANQSLLIHPKLGIGIKIQKAEEFKRYETIAYTAIKNKMISDSIAEEMRVFYVALTRACEKLIVLSTAENISNDMTKIFESIAFHGKKISPYYVLKQRRYAHWLLSACMRHPLAFKSIGKEAKLDFPVDDGFLLNDESKMNIVFSNISDLQEKLDENMLKECDVILKDRENSEILDANDDKEKQEEQEEQENILKALKERMDYDYPYKDLNRISTKYAASEFSQSAFNAEFLYFKKPDFMQEDEIRGSDIGTATHKFLQYFDFNITAENIKNEVSRLKLSNKISDAEMKLVNISQIQNFIKSSIFQRILKAEKVFREKRFSIMLPVDEIDGNISPNFSNEGVLIQGIIDLVFIENGKCVILDYKTDRIKEELELINLYSAQLNVYKKAASMLFSKPVSETIIYSLSLNKEIKLDT